MNRSSRRQRRQQKSIMDSAMRRGTSAQNFVPLVAGGFGAVALTYVLDRFFGVDKGLTVVVVGAVGLGAILYYLIRSAQFAKRDAEAKRAEFFDQFNSIEGDESHHGQ